MALGMFLKYSYLDFRACNRCYKLVCKGYCLWLHTNLAELSAVVECLISDVRGSVVDFMQTPLIKVVWIPSMAGSDWC